MFFDEIQIGQNLPVGRVRGGLLSLIFFGLFEFGAGKFRALPTDLKVLFLDAAGDDGAGWVFIEEVGTTAAGTS